MLLQATFLWMEIRDDLHWSNGTVKAQEEHSVSWLNKLLAVSKHSRQIASRVRISKPIISYLRTGYPTSLPMSMLGRKRTLHRLNGTKRDPIVRELHMDLVALAKASIDLNGHETAHPCASLRFGWTEWATRRKKRMPGTASFPLIKRSSVIEYNVQTQNREIASHPKVGSLVHSTASRSLSCRCIL